MRCGGENFKATIKFLHTRGIDTAGARPAAPPIQPDETLVGRLEEPRVGPLVHGLEDRDLSDSGLWAKVAPLHAGAYDAQDVVVSVVEAKKSRPPPRVRRKGFVDGDAKYTFEHSCVCL